MHSSCFSALAPSCRLSLSGKPLGRRAIRVLLYVAFLLVCVGGEWSPLYAEAAQLHSRMAEDDTSGDLVSGLKPTAAVLPSRAIDALYAALPIDVTLATASSDTLMEGLSSLMFAHEQDMSKQDETLDPLAPTRLFVEAACLVAIARPELGPLIEARVSSLYPDGADAIIERIRFSLEHPSTDQLAAIATREGTSPASGEDDNGSDS